SLAHVASLRLERDDVGRTHLQRARTEALYAALSTLSDLQREAFILREIEGLSMHDAATQAGVSTNAMTVRVWRAREAIRHELTRLGWLGGEEQRRTPTTRSTASSPLCATTAAPRPTPAAAPAPPRR